MANRFSKQTPSRPFRIGNIHNANFAIIEQWYSICLSGLAAVSEPHSRTATFLSARYRMEVETSWKPVVGVWDSLAGRISDRERPPSVEGGAEEKRIPRDNVTKASLHDKSLIATLPFSDIFNQRPLPSLISQNSLSHAGIIRSRGVLP